MIEYIDPKLLKKTKYRFEGPSVTTKIWIELDHNWIENNFKTRKPEFYPRLFWHHVSGQSDPKAIIFYIPIGSSKHNRQILSTYYYSEI